MPEQCSKATSGKRGATFCIGVPMREAGAEDQLVAGRGQLAEHALGILRHEDVVDDGDRDLVAELRLDRVDAEAVLLGPADLGDRR